MVDADNNYWSQLMGDDASAASYMETYGEGVGSDTRKTISDFIQDGESVLDVGSGPTWNYEHFKQYGPDISTYKAYDYSPRFVRVANQRIGKEVVHLGDCRDIKEPDNSWDVVLLQDVLEHTDGYEKPVREALRVAKKRVIITFWHMTKDTQTHINDDTDKGEDGYGAWYNQDEWEEFLNTLPYVWFDTESKPTDNRQHLFYIIDKGINA